MEQPSIIDPAAVAWANVLAALCPLLSIPIIGLGSLYTTLRLAEWIPRWLFLLLVPIGPLSFGPLGLLLKYFEIPLLPSIGIHIGGYLPASCKDNIVYEGPDSLPCSFRRLLDWLPRVSFSDRHIDEIEESWVVALLYTLFCVTVMLLDVYIICTWDNRTASQVEEDLELLIEFGDEKNSVLPDGYGRCTAAIVGDGGCRACLRCADVME